MPQITEQTPENPHFAAFGVRKDKNGIKEKLLSTGFRSLRSQGVLRCFTIARGLKGKVTQNAPQNSNLEQRPCSPTITERIGSMRSLETSKMTRVSQMPSRHINETDNRLKESNLTQVQHKSKSFGQRFSSSMVESTIRAAIHGNVQQTELSEPNLTSDQYSSLRPETLSEEVRQE